MRSFLNQDAGKVTLVVNFFAGPGAGKSALATGLFSRLKMQGINSEYVSEYAKELVWEGSLHLLSNQLFILAEQYRRIQIMIGKVEVVTTDCPIPLAILYRPRPYFPSFDSLAMELFNSMNNLNFYVVRPRLYPPIGRDQSEGEERNFDVDAKTWLDDSNIRYSDITGNAQGLDVAESMVLSAIESSQ